MRLSKLVEGIRGRIVYENGDWEREIDYLSADSRKIKESSLFFCLSGGEVDGGEFAKESIALGAVAIVTEKELSVCVPQFIVENSREALGVLSAVFYGNPTEKLKVVGITGTNGKTTTSYMLESICKANGSKVGVIGTLGICFDGQTKLSKLTTPDPIELQKTFAEMLRAGVEYVVMEVSAHALYYRKVAGVRFVACIFTNFTQDHLDFFHTMEAYKQAKMRLFTDASSLAVVNGDDEVGREIARQRQEKGSRTVFYGLSTPADGFAVITDEGLGGTECLFNVNDVLCRVSLSLTGRHNVYNALAAASCAIELGFPASAVSEGLSSLQGVTGRLQRVELSLNNVYVDFAHTPDGLKQSICALKEHCKGRLICLFGCGGNRDKEKRPLMGETAATYADFAIITSDNPRYEDPLDIISAIEKGFRRYSVKYVIVPDRRRGIEYALELLREEDVLLIAGKGGEEYQEIMGIKYPFNDHDMVIRILKEKGRKRL